MMSFTFDRRAPGVSAARSTRTACLTALAAFSALPVFFVARLLLHSAPMGLTLLAPILIAVIVPQHDARQSLSASFSAVAVYLLLCLLCGAARSPSDVAALLLGGGCTLFAAGLTGRLSARIRAQQISHAEQSVRDRQISDINTHLLTASSEEMLFHLTLRHLFDVTGCPSLFYTFPDGAAQCVRRYPDGLICYPTEDDAALCAFSEGREVGFGTTLHKESAFLYLPVRAGDETLAVVGLLCSWEAPPNHYLLDTVRLILVRTGVALQNQKLFLRQQSILMDKELEHIRTDFLRAISHDFRTPLTGIIGACSALSGGDVALSGADRRALVESIGEEAAWLLRMVENILSVTRVGSSGPALHKNPEPLEEILAEALDRTRKRFPALSLHITQPREFLMVPIDATLIIQVLMNLIENGAKYSDTSGVIDIAVEDRAREVAFSVRDYGSGLSAERLTDPFSPSPFRAGDSRHGMGLGLSICHSIVAAHGGTMEACNAPDGGAVFTFTLPKEDTDE